MRISFACVFVGVIAICPVASAADPLPSWEDATAKATITQFVQSVTKRGAAGYVEPSERIAVFDNDGCLWAEKPAYFQLLFAIDRVKQLAPQRPEWRNEALFKAVLEDDMRALVESGEPGLLQLIAATHAGMSTDEFRKTVGEWLETAKHPTTGKRFTEMVYQPMLELLAYLRANGFKTFIVSGGGIEFMRVFSEEVYGVPPEQVVGSRIKTKFEIVDGQPTLVRLPAIDFIDDKEGKPVGINQHIGRRPIFAAGNSDGDVAMLQWTTSAAGQRLGIIVHHDDGEREWAYDRDSHVGRLDRGLREAASRGWTVVSMRDDWRTVFASAP